VVRTFLLYGVTRFEGKPRERIRGCRSEQPCSPQPCQAKAVKDNHAQVVQ
jgi:hypothetical protein